MMHSATPGLRGGCTEQLFSGSNRRMNLWHTRTLQKTTPDRIAESIGTETTPSCVSDCLLGDIVEKAVYRGHYEANSLMQC